MFFSFFVCGVGLGRGGRWVKAARDSGECFVCRVEEMEEIFAPDNRKIVTILSRNGTALHGLPCGPGPEQRLRAGSLP